MLLTRSHLSGRDEQAYLAMAYNRRRSCFDSEVPLAQRCFSDVGGAIRWGRRGGRRKVRRRWSVQEKVWTMGQVVVMDGLSQKGCHAQFTEDGRGILMLSKQFEFRCLELTVSPRSLSDPERVSALSQSRKSLPFRPPPTTFAQAPLSLTQQWEPSLEFTC